MERRLHRGIAGAAWVHASSEDRFFPLEDLLWEHRELITATDSWDQQLASDPGGDLRPLPRDQRRHVIGYLTPVLTDVTMVVGPGEDPERIARRYTNSGWGEVHNRDGTTTLNIAAPTEVEALERPEATSPVVLRFRNDEPVLTGTYGGPDFFVFDRRPGWFQVRLRVEESGSRRWRRERTVWLRDSPVWAFHPRTDESERQRLADRVWGPEYGDMRVAGFRRVGDRLWVDVEVLDHSYCEGIDEPTVLMRGWMPVYSPSAEPTIRFFSRGC